MTWSCPHQLKGKCKKLGQKCHPGLKGCVLEGKVNRSQKRNNLKNSDDKNKPEVG